MARLAGGRAATEAEWLAFAARDGQAGLVYGVASTGIHCRAGRPARTPLRQNLRVFSQVAEADACGYRACKRCGGGQPNTDQPVSRASRSTANVPSCELPCGFSPGDQTAMEARPGAITSMPPPTPDLPGKPTR